MIEYHQYTAAQLRAWLQDGVVTDGLSEQVISRQRADAILHNPFLTDDFVVAVSATEGDRLIGFSAQFPDDLIRPEARTTCTTTLWVDPEYKGEFVSFELCRMMDASTNRYTIGINSVKASVLIDKLLGLKVMYAPRARFVMRHHLILQGWRSVGSMLLEPIRQFRQQWHFNRLNKLTKHLRVEWVDTVDSESYAFMASHSNNDRMLRSQDMYNWILHHPFVAEASSAEVRQHGAHFSSSVPLYRHKMAKVYAGTTLIGVYAYTVLATEVKMLWLYMDDNEQGRVLASLMQQVWQHRPDLFRSIYPCLTDFICRHRLALNMYQEQFSFSHPKEMNINDTLQLQGNDGDMFI